MNLLLTGECPSVDCFPSYEPVTMDGEDVPTYLPLRSAARIQHSTEYTEMEFQP